MMSGSSSRPYQSRLLNFVIGRSRRVMAQSQRTLRSLKTAATWGAQILLYPAYALFQTTRLIGRQIRQSIEYGVPLLGNSSAPPEAEWADLTNPDLFIDQVLAFAERQLNEGGTQFQLQTSGMGTAVAPLLQMPVTGELAAISSSAISAPMTAHATPSGAIASGMAASVTAADGSTPTASARRVIRAVASLVTTRTLVLVTDQNDVIDRLTVQQQQQLSQRIVWEVANYWRQQRVLQARQRQQQPLPPPRDLATLPLPMRLFQRLMGWVQTGQVAIAANLFQESALPPVGLAPAIALLPTEGQLLAERFPTEPLASYSNKVLQTLDITLADLEGGLLESSHPLQYLKSRLVTLLRSAGALVYQPASVPTVIRDPGERSAPAVDSALSPSLPLDPALLEDEWAVSVAFLEGPDSTPLGLTATASSQSPPVNPSQSPPVNQSLPVLRPSVWQTLQQVWQQRSRLWHLPVSRTELPQEALQWSCVDAAELPESLAAITRAESLSQAPLVQAAGAAAIQDPWLTWEDLFGYAGGDSSRGTTPKKAESPSRERSTRGFSRLLPTKSAAQPPALPHAQSRPSRLVHQTQSAAMEQPTKGRLTLNQNRRDRSGSPKPGPAVNAGIEGGAIAVPAPTQIHAYAASSRAVVEQPIQPDWIDTNATPLGYIQSPLERFLRWCDRAFLWVEDVLLMIWKWLKQTWLS